MFFIMLILLIVYSNNFDSFNRISFIFLNIPINEYIQKIKNKNGIISAQIWFISEKERYRSKNVNFDLTQILFKYTDYWENKKDIIFNYFNNFTEKVKLLKHDIKLLLKQYENIEYAPDFIKNNIFLIYSNIILYLAFEKMTNVYSNNSEYILSLWKEYFNDYSTFIKEINESKYQLSNNQKIRLVHAFYFKYFNLEIK